MTVKYNDASTAKILTTNTQSELILVSNATTNGTWDISTGGSGSGSAYTQASIANNQATPADVTGLLLSNATTNAASIEYSVRRSFGGGVTGVEDTAYYTNLGIGFNSYAQCASSDASGVLFVGGSFTALNGNTRNRLVKLNADGTDNTTFATNINNGFGGAVNAVKYLSDTTVVAGGSFISFDLNTRNHLVKLSAAGVEDTSFYTNLGTGFFGNVYALAELSTGKIGVLVS